MKKTTDVLVIGGGAVGSATLYYLAKHGVKGTLVDRGTVGDGTSSRCDGNVMACDSSPGYDTHMALMSAMQFPTLAEELDYEIHWEKRGSLLLFENEQEMEMGRRHVEEIRADGVPARIVEYNELHEDEPMIARDIPGAIETASDGCLDPLSLVFGMTLAATRLGAAIDRYTEVTAIERQGNGYLVKTTRDDYATPVVVNCGGAWSAHIGRMVGLNIPIVPRQGMILVAEQTFRLARRKTQEFGYMMSKYGEGDRPTLTDDMKRYGVAMVYEPTHVNNFLLGSSRQFTGYDTKSNARIMRAIAERGVRFFPAMKDVHIIRSYAGVRPSCEDHRPIVGESDLPGFYIAAGHEGNGIGMSPISGLLIAQMVTGAKEFVIDPEPMRFSRFENRFWTAKEA